MNKPTHTRIVSKSFTPTELAIFMKTPPQQMPDQRVSLGQLFDPNWAEVDLMACVCSRLPQHMPPMLVEFIQTTIKDKMVRRAYLQPRLHAGRLELLTPWKAAFDAAMRAYSSQMLFLGEPEIAFAAAFVAPISRFAALLPDASSEEGGDEPDMGGQLPLFPTDPNALRADLLHDALRQLARRSTSMADTLSAVLNLDRASFDVDREQVARLTGVVALAVTPLHNRWPVTAQERALSVKYLRP